MISVLGLSAVPGLGFRTMNVGGHEVYPFRTRSGLAPSRVIEVEAPHATDPTVRSTYETDHGDVDMLVQPDQRLPWMLDAVATLCPGRSDGDG